MKLLIKTSYFFSLMMLYSAFSNAASFEKYFQKLLKFEGTGYGIHRPIWGNRTFTKDQAFRIHKVHYWNKYKGDLFDSQEVAEVFIDHLINAGEGKESVNIKALEAIIGVSQDGILSKEDVKKANEFAFYEQIVNPYINFRIFYYHSRPNCDKYRGWFVRAKSFQVFNKEGEVVADYLVLPKELDKKLVVFEANACEESENK